MTLLDTKSKLKTNGEAPRRRTSLRRRALLFGGILAVLAIGVASWGAVGANKPAPAPPTAVAAAPLSAHGTIEPAAQATIATMNGGVVRALGVRVGQVAEDHQSIAEISLPAQTEILLAPWRGTILGLNVHLGDTVMPGAVVATIGDLSRYQVRTTDVDEYLISQIQPNQQVSVTVEALDGRQIEGTVDTVALAQQSAGTGVVNYPVVIRLFGDDPDIRPGMTVRIVFSPKRALP